MNKKLFIENKLKMFNEKHNNKYDYSLVDYVNSRIKIKIICSEHGIFEQRLDQHLNSNGCPVCSNKRKKSTEQFIQESIKIHGNKYDYSLVNYINNKTKVKIICKEHGVFEQMPNAHLNGQNCLKCVNEKQTKTKTKFIKDSIKTHNNKYDYSLVKYINNKTKVKIVCKEHGMFEQKPSNHLSGHGCKKCNDDKKRLDLKEIWKKIKGKYGDLYEYNLNDYINNYSLIKIKCKEHGLFYQNIKTHLRTNGCPYCSKKKMNTELFKSICSKLHNNIYDYSLVEYISSHKKVKIICKKHGVFEQKSYMHLQNIGCPKCKSSKGEKRIINFLDKKNIKYEYQKIFDDCKYKSHLPFDFYLTNYNVCIEYDGEQHYKSCEYFGGEKQYKLLLIKDKIKNDYCYNNNIKLIRIKYIDINNIESILKKILKLNE